MWNKRKVVSHSDWPTFLHRRDEKDFQGNKNNKEVKIQQELTAVDRRFAKQVDWQSQPATKDAEGMITEDMGIPSAGASWMRKYERNREEGRTSDANR